MTSKNYTANILGEEREVRGWNKEGNLLLADGSCYTFETLIEKAHLPLNRKLLAVASLRWLDNAWVLKGKCLDDWLNEQPVRELLFGQPAEDGPMRFAGAVLRENLREFGIGSAEREEIEAVAWFEDKGGSGGWDKPILLRSFRQIKGAAQKPTGQHEIVVTQSGFITVGRLQYVPGFMQVWFGGECYDLSTRKKSRFCIQFLVEQQAFDEKTARHLKKEIDPYVRKQAGDLPPSADIRIDHYFHDTKDPRKKLEKLRKDFIRAAGRNGRYYLKVN